MWKVLALVSLALAAPRADVDFTPLNAFSLQLLYNTYAFQESYGEKNLVISPLSIWSMFTLLAEGCSGDTFTQLLEGLRLPKDARQTTALHLAVSDILLRREKDVLLEGISGLFVDYNLNLHEEFCQYAKNFDTQVFVVDPRNKTLLANDINTYICRITRGRIENAISPSALDNLRMILVDGIYFKANWTYPFDSTQTREEAFYNYQGKTIGSVNMMYHKAPHNVGDSPAIGAQILEMPYGMSEQLSMLILLPFDGIPLQRLLENLSKQPLTWINEFHTSEALPEIDCYIPRFQVTSQIEMIQPLTYMGIRNIFDSTKAQMPGISDNPLYVSQTIQNVNIEVTEEGTVAASSTIVGLEDRILSQRFEANKEFVFLIKEKLSGLIVFAGVYAEPSLL
ncbi:serine protease inhibitor 77Ba-like [Battus philenor]|uniref:serine protease inhibitor 77Ba-like n=1 Tax=Battus philenor TaxID=42288 RepID=UPI0035D0B0F9